jgi:phospholipid N-methyltransferase
MWGDFIVPGQSPDTGVFPKYLFSTAVKPSSAQSTLSASDFIKKINKTAQLKSRAKRNMVIGRDAAAWKD